MGSIIPKSVKCIHSATKSGLRVQGSGGLGKHPAVTVLTQRNQDPATKEYSSDSGGLSTVC